MPAEARSRLLIGVDARVVGLETDFGTLDTKAQLRRPRTFLPAAPRRQPFGANGRSGLAMSRVVRTGQAGVQFVAGDASHCSISRRVVGPLGRVPDGRTPSSRQCAAVVRAPVMGSVASAHRVA